MHETDLQSEMEKGDQSTLAYRDPKLPNVAEDLVVSNVLDLDCDERLWVPQAPDVWFRPLCFMCLWDILSTFCA